MNRSRSVNCLVRDSGFLAAALPEGEFALRARDRNHAVGVPGLADPGVRAASEFNSEIFARYNEVASAIVHFLGAMKSSSNCSCGAQHISMVVHSAGELLSTPLTHFNCLTVDGAGSSGTQPHHGSGDLLRFYDTP